MDIVSSMRFQNASTNTRRYSSWKLPVVLSQMQAWNIDLRTTTEYICYQRARRSDAEPVTHEVLSPVVIGFFLSNTQRQPAPADGERKNRCRAGCFRALNIHIPAAVLRNQGRRLFLLIKAFHRPYGGHRRMHYAPDILSVTQLWIIKKSLAPVQGQQCFYCVLYDVATARFVLPLCPVGRFRSAGLFYCRLKSCLFQKYFWKFSKKRAESGVSGVILAEREKSTRHPHGKTNY